MASDVLPVPWVLLLLVCAVALLVAYVTWRILPPARSLLDRVIFVQVFFGLLICAVIVVLLPIDLQINLFTNGAGADVEGLRGLDYDTMMIAWSPLYWISQLCSQAAVLLFALLRSGYLTPGTRFKATVLDWLKLRVGAVAVGLIVILGVYLSGNRIDTQDEFWSLLGGYLKALLNAVGQIQLMLFLGYGLWNVPLRVYRSGSVEQRRRVLLVEERRCRYFVEQRQLAWEAAQDLVDKQLQQLPSKHSLRAVYEASKDDPLLMDIMDDGDVEADWPAEQQDSIALDGSTRGARRSGATENTPLLAQTSGGAATTARAHTSKRMHAAHAKHAEKLTKEHAQLAKVRAKLILAKIDLQEAENDLVDVQTELAQLRDVDKNSVSTRNLFAKLGAAAAGALSLLIVWSETIGLTSVAAVRGGSTDGDVVDLSHLSIVGIILRNSLDFAYETFLLCLLPLLYICACTYTSVLGLKVRFLNIYAVRVHHDSEPASVVKLTAFLLALINPICLNFVLIVGNWDGNTDRFPTAYQGFYGDMAYVPLFGSLFSVYIPWLLVVTIVATVLQLPARIDEYLRTRKHMKRSDTRAGRSWLRTMGRGRRRGSGDSDDSDDADRDAFRREQAAFLRTFKSATDNDEVRGRIHAKTEDTMERYRQEFRQQKARDKQQREAALAATPPLDIPVHDDAKSARKKRLLKHRLSMSSDKMRNLLARSRGSRKMLWDEEVAPVGLQERLCYTKECFEGIETLELLLENERAQEVLASQIETAPSLRDIQHAALKFWWMVLRLWAVERQDTYGKAMELRFVEFVEQIAAYAKVSAQERVEMASSMATKFAYHPEVDLPENVYQSVVEGLSSGNTDLWTESKAFCMDKLKETIYPEALLDVHRRLRMQGVETGRAAMTLSHFCSLSVRYSTTSKVTLVSAEGVRRTISVHSPGMQQQLEKECQERMDEWKAASEEGGSSSNSGSSSGSGERRMSKLPSMSKLNLKMVGKQVLDEIPEEGSGASVSTPRSRGVSIAEKASAEETQAAYEEFMKRGETLLKKKGKLKRWGKRRLFLSPDCSLLRYGMDDGKGKWKGLSVAKIESVDTAKDFEFTVYMQDGTKHRFKPRTQLSEQQRRLSQRFWTQGLQFVMDMA